MGNHISEVVALTQRLVQIESTNVGTFEGEISLFVEDWLKKSTKAEIVRDEFEPGRFNVMATLKGETSHPNLLYLAHMDTVPVGSGWTKDPFAGEIEGNRLYGRGALDMKCGLASAMIAFRDFENECREKGVVPKYDFVFVATGDEEDVMKGADRLVQLGVAHKDSLVLDTEPTNTIRLMPEMAMGAGGQGANQFVAMAHKGKTWFEISTYGKPAHGSTPYAGIDAIIAMAEVVLEIRNRINSYDPDPMMGAPSVCFGTIKGGFNTNIVADSCTITIDMRLSPPLTTEGSYKLVEDAIAAGTARVPGSTGDYKVIAKRPFVVQNDDSFLLAKLRESCKAVLGEDITPFLISGYTDSGVIDGSTGCGNGMSYGPAGEGAHQADEYVLCDSIEENLAVISDLARRILM